MDTTTAATAYDNTRRSGVLRRTGRAVLGGAAILIVGAGAMPAADAAQAGVTGGLKHTSSVTRQVGVSPSALPVENRASAARFVVTKDGKLDRLS